MIILLNSLNIVLYSLICILVLFVVVTLNFSIMDF